MTRKNPTIRSPIRRQGAEEYLLITLLSFAASVSITRFFLYLTGYPQIGRGELHIAHVLWGGLLLFIASLIPLILANRWAYVVTSVLSGIGVGLFIDEVGKFITRSNNYFYPWAAPIIYVFFLMTVLVYVRLRRPLKEDFRADLYYILEDLQEVLDHDLSEKEREDILSHLDRVKRLSKNDDLIELAGRIEDFMASRSLQVIPDQITFLDRARHLLERFEGKWLSRMRFRAILVGALAALSFWALYYPFFIITSVYRTKAIEPILIQLLTNQTVQSSSGATMYSAMLTLQIIAGLAIATAAVLLSFGRDRRAIGIGTFSLLFSLTAVNVLVFYFDQFSTIINSGVQLFVLLLALRYRALYLPRPQTKSY